MHPCLSAFLSSVSCVAVCVCSRAGPHTYSGQECREDSVDHYNARYLLLELILNTKLIYVHSMLVIENFDEQAKMKL